MERIPHGYLQSDFEVPFRYREQEETKMELVKLRLCLRCAPLLFASQGEPEPACATWKALNSRHEDSEPEAESVDGPAKVNDRLPHEEEEKSRRSSRKRKRERERERTKSSRKKKKKHHRKKELDDDSKRQRCV